MHRHAKLIALVVGVCMTVGGMGCAPRIEALSGRVEERSIAVQVPLVPWPVPDLDAGFGEDAPPTGTGASADAAPASRTSALAAITAIGTWSRLASVCVDVGDVVKEGDVVATLDTAALDADIVAARMNARVAAAQVRVLGDRLSELADARADLDDARASAKEAKAQLLATRDDLISQRTNLVRLLETLEKMPPGTLPPGGPPSGTNPPTGVTPTGAPVPGTPPGPGPGAPPSIAELRAGIAKIDAALARIDEGLARARRGLARLARARFTVADARASLTELRELARIAADAAKVFVRVAALHRSVAVVRAPASGVVVDAARSGDVLAAGATLALIEPTGPPRVSVWVTPAVADGLAARLRRDAITADARTDWSGARTAGGRVVHIGTRAQFPPTSFATREVHLSRAVEVTLEFPDPPFALPAGAPVDVTIR